MNREILKVISDNSIYDYIELEEAYKILESFDDLLYAISEAPKHNMNLWDMCRILMRKDIN